MSLHRASPDRTGKKPRILVLAGLAPSLINFRGTLLQALVRAGMDVVCTAPEADAKVAGALADLGARYVPVAVRRNQIGVWNDLRYALALYGLFRRERPDLVLAYTAKPVIYGLSAARLAGIRSRHALITGLGYAFTPGEGERRPIRAIVQRLYRHALSGARKVFFQNPDDRDEFLRRGLVSAEQVCVVNGSGVDLLHFSVAPVPSPPASFLLIARLLADKGVREFVDAARQVRAQVPEARFVLVGPTDPNPAAISPDELAQWCREGVVEYGGVMKDVRPFVAQCTAYVLPSYREGTPRTNLEAMAMGRPIITTDAPGCRETVEQGVNGFLVPPKDAAALAAAMMQFVRDPALAARMGAASRHQAEQKYDVHKVNAVMLREMGIG